MVDIIVEKLHTTFEVVLESGCGEEDRQRFPKNFQVNNYFSNVTNSPKKQISIFF